MNDVPAKATLVGDPVDSPVKTKRPSRAKRIEAWRTENAAAYTKACNDAHCTCTPTRAQMLIMDQWTHPPID